MDPLNEEVLLVTKTDEAVGTADKLLAHREGLLHRAFSAFLFDERGRLLVQKRADGKYHSAALWTNSCCSHPRPGETVINAAQRRIQEELGISAAVHHRFSFVYEAQFDNGLKEHEFDHVLFGRWSGEVFPDPNEVAEWKYMSTAELNVDLHERPEAYTAWLHACWPRVLEELRERPTPVSSDKEG